MTAPSLNGRIRDWLAARPGVRFPFGTIADGLGLTGDERLKASWSVALMVKGGMLDAVGEHHGRTYGFVREPLHRVLTPEERRERRNARARALNARKRTRTNTQYQAERKAKAQAKREAKAAAREARRIEREATAEERAAKRREYCRLKALARGAMLRQRREAERAAKVHQPKALPRSFDQTVAVVVDARVETVAEWQARTGQRPQRLRDGEVSKHNRLQRIGAHA